MKKTHCENRILKLTLVLLLAALGSACGNAETAQTPADTASVTPNEITETAETEAVNPDVIPPSPTEAKDLGGDAIRFAVHERTGINFNLCDIRADAENGESINDAVFRRNSAVMEKYNVNFEWKESGTPENDVKKSVIAGDNAFDFGLPPLSVSFALGTDGVVCDLNTVPNFDLHGLGWMRSAAEDAAIGGKNFFGVGDINLLSYDGTGVVLFSKTLASQNDITDLYSRVKDGTWTFDCMYDYSKALFRDLNGNGADDAEDQYGFTCNLYASDCFALSTDMRLIGKDSGGNPAITMNSDRFITYFSKVTEMINDRSITLFADRKEYAADRQTIPLNAFSESRVLFYYETMAFITQLRSMQLDFGLLPFPKFDESQETYYNFIHSGASSTVVIPRTVEENTERFDSIGRIASDLAYYSYYLVRPAYYDTTITGKFIRDAESYEMLDYILQNSRCDFAILMQSSGLSLLTDLRNIISGNKDSISSELAKKEKNYQKTIDKVLDKLEKMDG